MKSNKCLINGLILIMLLLSYALYVSAEEETEATDLSVESLIRESKLDDTETIEEDISEEEEISIEEIEAIVEEEASIEEIEAIVEEIISEREVDEVLIEEIGAIEEEIITEEAIEVFIPPEEEIKGFDFIAWLKKILGIKEIEYEEVSYIATEDIAIGEEEIVIGDIEEPKEEEIPDEIKKPIEKVAIRGEVSKKEGAKVIIVKETDLINLVPKAYDPDKDLLKYTFTTPLDETGKWQTSYGDGGEYTITVTASDGELSSSKEVLIIVNRKEEAPSIDSFSPESTTLEADENSIVGFEVEVSDLNQDELLYSWKLDGKEVSSKESFTYEITYDDAGSHTMKLAVSDSALESTKLWSIKVKNVNRLPVLETISDLKVMETDTIKITPKATDPDGDEIEFTISEPVGNKGIWETTYDDGGEYTVKVTASDGIDSTSQEVKISIENVNRAPIITDILQG